VSWTDPAGFREDSTRHLLLLLRALGISSRGEFPEPSIKPPSLFKHPLFFSFPFFLKTKSDIFLGWICKAVDEKKKRFFSLLIFYVIKKKECFPFDEV